MSREGRETVDVIVPLRNEEHFLPGLINGIQNQDYPVNRTILVVAPSEDKTMEIAMHYASYDSSITVLENPKRTAPFAMNLGLSVSGAKYWIRIDGHTAVPRDLISKLVQEIQKIGAACVGPKLRHGAESHAQAVIGIALSSPFGVGNARFRLADAKSGPVDTVAFGLYDTAWTNKLEGFNEALTRNQDDEFNTRLRRIGGTIWLTDTTQVTYYPRTSIRKLVIQRVRSGYWRAASTFQHRNQVRARQLAPALLSGGTLVGTMLTLRGKPALIRRLTLAYGAALTAHVLWAYRRGNSFTNAVRSTLPVAATHYGYGTGYLGGVIAIAVRATSSAMRRRRVRSSRSA